MSNKAVLTKETAARIGWAYSEIEAAEELIKTIDNGRQRGEEPDFRDTFGRQRGLQLGVPSGTSSHRMVNINKDLAKIVIEAHISDKRSELEALFTLARQQLAGDA